MFSKIFIILLMFINPQLIAAPMSYKGSITTMGEASKHFSKVESNYALTGKDSIGIKAFKLKGDGYDVYGEGLFYLKRLMRVNEIESQTNLWLFTESGQVSVKKNSRNNDHFYLSPKIQFDYETRRIYAMTSHQILRVQHDNFDTTKAKAGFSFHKTEYNETQPWFILELIHTNSMSKKLEIIPTIRLINKALYLEAGVSTDGNPKLHLMHTF
tara:strand:+ start:695 stop:1333 length:639 start_codon:yes stop_codon:yes gene_type:complete